MPHKGKGTDYKSTPKHPKKKGKQMTRRTLQGVVVSNKADKTVTVKVERKVTHPVYKKIIRLTKKYAAHDEQNKFVEGDIVKIMECKPISKTKCWEVVYEDNNKKAKA